MEKKKEDKKGDRFTYDSDLGLSIISGGKKEEVKKSEEQDITIKKDYTKWL